MTDATLAFADILAGPAAALVEPLDPRVWVEAKDKLPAKEEERQRAFLAFMRKHAKRVMVFAIPNATQSRGSKLKQFREGAWYGATDLVCVWTGGIAFVEFKAGRTMPEPNQIAFINELVERGHHAAIVRTADGAVRWLHGLGAPVPAIQP